MVINCVWVVIFPAASVTDHERVIVFPGLQNVVGVAVSVGLFIVRPAVQLSARLNGIPVCEGDLLKLQLASV